MGRKASLKFIDPLITESHTFICAEIDSPVKADRSSTARSEATVPSDWSHIAASNRKTVAQTNRVERHLLQRPIAMPDRGSGHACEEGCHLPMRVVLRKALEVLAARIHQCDDHRRQFLAEHQGGSHRESRTISKPTSPRRRLDAISNKRAKSTGIVEAIQAHCAHVPLPMRWNARPSVSPAPDVATRSGRTIELEGICAASRDQTREPISRTVMGHHDGRMKCSLW